jgi:hypothetical protein
MVVLTGALVGVGTLQLLVFAGQIIVFGLQARRLRETIEKMDEIAKGGKADTQALLTATKDLAEASADHAGHTRASVDAYRSAERAWLGAIIVDYQPYVGMVKNENVTNGLRFQIRFVNGGRTPATGVICYRDYKILPSTEQAIPTFGKIPEDASSNVNSVVIPNVLVYSGPVFLNNAEAEAIRSGKSKLILWGLIEYYDTLFPGVMRETECCFEMRFQGEMENRDTGRRMEIFASAPIGPQNRAA